MEKICCMPNNDGARQKKGLISKAGASSTVTENDTAVIPGGQPILGTSSPKIADDGEELRKWRVLKPFGLGISTVTNAQFSSFIQATGYETDAERYGWSFVFWSDVSSTISATIGVAGLEWWRRVEGANWRDINGPGTANQTWHLDHPVVHVSWNDALAFANWCGGRLPMEAEWEHAARGGLGDVAYPWGDRDPDDHSFLPCNIWQGQFPEQNTGADGYLTTAPAISFSPNRFGLYNLVGNVWEWTADHFRIPSLKSAVQKRLKASRGFRVVKGGSFLCHSSYCWRYRIAARASNSPDSSTSHMGFRVAFSIQD